MATMLGLSESIGEVALPKVTLPTPPKARKTEDTALSLLGEQDVKATKLIAFEQPDSTLPRAVVFRDSFSTAMIPYLSEHFSRSVYYWDFRLNDALIEQEKPNIIIHVFVGRQFAVFNNIQLEATQPPKV